MADEAGGETPRFGYFEHGADIGVIGRGSTVEEAFVQAAEAMFRIMDEGDGGPAPVRVVHVSFAEDDLELALVTWLNRLLAAARIEGLHLVRFELRRDGSQWEGTAAGVPAAAAGEDRGVEVKGATLTMLEVRPDAGGWEARCVVDV